MKMVIPLHYDLKVLRDVTEKILREMPHVEGAINWGDIHCVSALRCEDDHGEVEYRVELEEAAPDASELQRYVHNCLKERGYEHVAVYTEW